MTQTNIRSVLFPLSTIPPVIVVCLLCFFFSKRKITFFSLFALLHCNRMLQLPVKHAHSTKLFSFLLVYYSSPRNCYCFPIVVLLYFRWKLFTIFPSKGKRNEREEKERRRKCAGEKKMCHSFITKIFLRDRND